MKYEPIIADRYYHIYNRGNNKQSIFFEEKNYDYFISLIVKYLIPVANIYSYCLIKNHFHILIKTKTDIPNLKISKALSNLFNAYAKAINKAYSRSGSLFQDRFKRKIIENEEYLETLIIYIHLNPRNHKLIEDFRAYRHSSYSKIISTENSFLSKEQIIDLFYDKSNFASVHFQRQEEILELDKNIFLE
ncbi:REP element-mobilizing transposase RayT [Salegentibacter holothuriorum]|uniref:REP element-mobilizing transposase RayT n=1 Tax=Salegentibacter holothuriorum TaxID=241145 RepID=A0A1T5BFU3_9FLAO|nr:transposase [Salegentibacter holothuriorum]SKB46108.1 REP element-mobilizing transposase RayT [Salegentibacter holothuriorum]